MSKAKSKQTKDAKYFIDVTLHQTEAMVGAMISGEVLRADQMMDIVRRFAQITQDAYPEHDGLFTAILEAAGGEIFANCMIGK